MSLYRVYHDEETRIDGARLLLSKLESHHLLKVRRAREGDRVDVLDAKGGVIECYLKKPGKQAALQMISRIYHAKPRPCISLAVAMLKSKAMDLLVRQACEMGVSVLQPVLTAHSEVRLGRRQLEEKVARWHAIGVEACKQSGSAHLPEFQEAVDLDSWLQSCPENTNGWVASLQPGAGSVKMADPSKAAHSVLIGPEGDFSAREYALIQEAGFVSLSLGENVLRSETAALCAVATLRERFSL